MARKRELAAIRAAKARKKRRYLRRRKKRLRAVILFLETIILIMLMGTAYIMAKYDKFQRVEIDDVKVNEGIKLEGYTTIALFGGDSREGQLEEGTHADTIIVVAIDNESKEIRMASIYRDTLLRQMNDTYRKANNAYFVGGPEEAINMLNKNLDLDIEDYATVDFKAMSDVVDLMGGIEVTVTDAEAEMMNKYIGETAKAAHKKANELEDPFFKKGILLVVDAMEAEKVREILENEVGSMIERHDGEVAIYDKASSYAPAFGMIGTLVGLVNMLKSMDLSSGSSSNLGVSMATALVTTFYGCILANLLFGPIAKKLRIRNDEEVIYKQVIIEGVVGIQAGDNPKVLKEKLVSLLHQTNQQKILNGEEGGGGKSKKSKK